MSAARRHREDGGGVSSSQREVSAKRVAKQVGELRAGRSREAGFPAGRSADLAQVQRARLLSAAAHVVGELGYSGMSVARVTSRAGVSRRTFYELFDDREDCFLALFDDALARAMGVARDAVEAVGQDGWREQVRTGLLALLLFVGDEHALGSLLVVDALGGGPRVLKRRARALEALRTIVDEGRSQARAGHEPPPLTAEGVVGAVLSVIHARLLEQATNPPTNDSSRPHNQTQSLTGLLNPLMGMIVLPYLGRAAAARELARPTPKISRSPKVSHTQQAPSQDPLEGLDMRLTYRTLLVLSAISTQPGASNRQVADTAGVHDQGQISKLLGRLERLGLIHNAGNGQPRGEPNAWTLTDKGIEVEQALSL